MPKVSSIIRIKDHRKAQGYCQHPKLLQLARNVLKKKKSLWYLKSSTWLLMQWQNSPAKLQKSMIPEGKREEGRKGGRTPLKLVLFVILKRTCQQAIWKISVLRRKIFALWIPGTYKKLPHCSPQNSNYVTRKKMQKNKKKIDKSRGIKFQKIAL